MSYADTIFAASSGGFPCGVCVMRLSGAESFAVARVLCGALPRPRYAALRVLRDPRDGDVIDKGLVLCFPSPRSFTGEDMVEFHLHGSLAVLDHVSGLLRQHFGLRLAEAGEFTRRAFYADKLDVTQAEATADLMRAKTTLQKRLALRQMDGALTRHYETWRQELIGILALTEAAIDFADEDLPKDMQADWTKRLLALTDALTAHLADTQGCYDSSWHAGGVKWLGKCRQIESV